MIELDRPGYGGVKPVDGIQHALMRHCALQPDFVDEIRPWSRRSSAVFGQWQPADEALKIYPKN